MGTDRKFDAVDAVRQASDLFEVVSEYVALKKSGAKFRGLCPFHQEKTPSFYVDPDKQLYYCFGCQSGGDVFKFLMQYEKLEFPEALRSLASRFNVTLPERRDAGEASERQKIVALNRLALAFFRETLLKPDGEKGRRYLASRGLHRDVAERYALGYAPEGWTGLKDHLARIAIRDARGREDVAVTAGLLGRKEESGRTYDRFRDRILFPIVNLSDEVIGFGGRVLGTGEPKYLNSPDSPAFNKGENLYGLPFAREAIRKSGYAILVEGYMDAIALQTAGFEQAVATLGTGFTPGHVRLLKRFTEAVVVNFDPDAAGRQATRRSLETLLEHGFEVRVVALPQGKDPDRFVRDEGSDRYRAELQSALPYVEYLARETAGRIDVRGASGKVKALNEVLPFVARIDHPVRRASQVEMLASVFGIEDRLVLQELKNAVRDRRRDVRAVAPGSSAARRAENPSEAYLVRALLDDGQVRKALLPEIDGEEFGSTNVKEIVNAVRRLEEAGEQVTWPRVGSEVSDVAREALNVIAAAPQPAPSVEAGRACLKSLHRDRILKEMAELQKEIQTRQAAGRAADELSLRKQALNRQIEALRGATA